MTVHNLHDIEEQLAVVWKALEDYQDRVLVPPFDGELTNETWDDICLAMAVIREQLDLPSETEPALPPVAPEAVTLETAAEIRAAIDAGHKVKCNGGGYDVIKDSIGQYLIHFPPNNNYIGLAGRAGTKYADHLNGRDFYIA